jgi:hypothetical protein
MTTAKNSGLGARRGTVGATLGTSRVKAPSSVPVPPPIVPLSVRLPKSTHDVLRKMAFDRRVSIHSLILEGVEKVIAEKG